jgi:outer membrane protein assembly factor BamA
MRGFVISLFLLLSIQLLAQNQNNESIAQDTVVTIGKIYITGHKKTRIEIIKRELDFTEGLEITKSKLLELIQQNKQKLINTRLFVAVEIIPLMMTSTNADILIQLKERWYIFPVPIFKLADRNFTEWWVNQNADFSRVNYGLQLYHFNLTGRNDRAAVIAQFGFTNRYQIQYQIPYFNKKQTLGLFVSTGFNNNKSVSYNTYNHRLQFVESEELLRKTYFASTALTYRPSYYSRHSFNLGYNDTSIADTVRNLNSEYFLEGRVKQQYLRFSYIYTWDKRDFISYPLKGKNYRVELSQYGLGVFDDLDMFVVRLAYGQYVELGENLFLANHFSVKYNFSDDIPYINRSGIGYRPDFVRGYERDVVEGKYYAANRSEFKWRFFSGTKELYGNSKIQQFQTLPFAFYLKTFLDLGYVGTPLPFIEGSQLNEKLLMGAGIGLDVQTYYDFVVRFEYSINKEGVSGFYINFKSAF